KDVIMENYSKDKPILYRGGPPSGVDVLPSSLITDPEKTFRNKIAKWFEKRDEPEFKEMSKIFSKERGEYGKIEKEIKKKYEDIEKDERRNVLLTVKIIHKGVEKHLGEIEAFQRILTIEERFYRMSSIGESRGKGICRLCGGEKEVYGFVLPSIGFSFATADKPGFEYEFDRTSRWKQIPLCSECGFSLMIAKNYIDEHLTFPKTEEKNFIGYPYYVIPKFVIGEMFEELKRNIEFFKDKAYDEGLLSREDWLMRVLMDKHDILRLIFMFYKKQTGGKYIDIVRYVEDVLPSWMRKIYSAQDKVKTMEVFGESTIKKILGKNWTGNLVKGLIGKQKKDRFLGENNWYAVFLRDFFPSSRLKGQFNVYYIDLISSILSGKPISEGFLLQNFMREIRREAKRKNIYNLRLLALESFMLYLFLDELNLLRCSKLNSSMVGEVQMSSQDKNSIELRLEEFFQRYGISDPAKKASFAVGAFVEYVLNTQRNERNVGYGEEPFLVKLHGFLLDEKRVKKIFSEALNKLRQYRRGYPCLEEAVSRCMLESGEGWDLSKDEISYYFTLGLTLSKEFWR
ncbi:MAG: type I-B CRISPR-associated protein Cas8b/Csh1, partial [Candidatus Bathyarchaeia archaeon]